MDVEPILPRKLLQNDVSARGPLTVPQEFPITAPYLEVYTGGSDSVKKTLASWFPSAQKANCTVPAGVLRGQRTVDLITISQRHVNRWLANPFILLPLV